MDFRQIKSVVLDLDGVLWRGDEALPGMVELFAWLHEAQFPYMLATNNSSRTRQDYFVKLEKMGVPGVPEERILTSSVATAAYLQSRYMAGTRIHVLGMKGLREALDSAGFDIDGADDSPPEIVVVGIDFELTYAKLKETARHLLNGAEFIGTNPDKTFPLPDGLVPGTGSLIAALEATAGRPATIIGKPGKPMFQAALDMLGTAPSQTLMVGDRLDTDIAGAKHAGLQTALLLSGVTSEEDLAESDLWPDVAYKGLPELLRAWAGDDWYQEQVKARRGR
jgi:4-nitrophenyl phosphatase